MQWRPKGRSFFFQEKNTYCHNGLIHRGEAHWHAFICVCFIWKKLKKREQEPPVKLSGCIPLWTHTKTFSIHCIICHYTVIIISQIGCQEVHFPPYFFVSFPMSLLPVSQHTQFHRADGIPQLLELLKPSILDCCHHFNGLCINGQRHHKDLQIFIKYPTLCVECGWETFHPLNKSVILLQWLKNATAIFLRQSKYYVSKEFPLKRFYKDVLHGNKCLSKYNITLNFSVAMHRHPVFITK